MDWRSSSEKNFALISSPNGLIHNVQAWLANFGRRVNNAGRWTVLERLVLVKGIWPLRNKQRMAAVQTETEAQKSSVALSKSERTTVSIIDSFFNSCLVGRDAVERGRSRSLLTEPIGAGCCSGT